MKIAHKAFTEIMQVLSLSTVMHILLDRTAQGKAPGAGIKEPRPMGSILHAIRKSQCLLIIIEARGHDLRNHGADFRSTAYAH